MGNLKRFYPFVMETFGASSNIPKMLVFSILLLLRKHVLFHLEIGSGLGKPQLSVLRREDQRVDLTMFHERCLNLARCVGFSNMDRTDQNVISLLNGLKTVHVPSAVQLECDDLDFLVKMTNLTCEDVKTLWLDNVDTCFCPKEHRCNKLLLTVFMDICTDKIARTEHCSLKEARRKAALKTESEIVMGVFRLALEMWSLDFDVTACSNKHGEQLPQMFKDSSCIPATMQVVVDAEGVPVTVIPKRILHVKQYDHWELGNGDDDIDECSSSDYDDDRCRENYGKFRMKKDEYGVDVELEMSSQLDHPYVQLKMSILTQRGYSPDAATKMLIWHLLPPNSTIPFQLLLQVLDACHPKARSWGKSNRDEFLKSAMISYP